MTSSASSLSSVHRFGPGPGRLPLLLLRGTGRAADPVAPAGNAARLATTLGKAVADVRHRTLPVGHGLSQADVAIAKAWAERLQHRDTAHAAHRHPPPHRRDGGRPG